MKLDLYILLENTLSAFKGVAVEIVFCGVERALENWDRELESPVGLAASLVP